MAVTVIVAFRAAPGKAHELVQFLRDNQPRLVSFPGFRSIVLTQDECHPDRVVEVERWDEGAQHRAMVEAIGAEGGWAPLEALTEGDPEVSYLAEVALLP